MANKVKVHGYGSAKLLQEFHLVQCRGLSPSVALYLVALLASHHGRPVQELSQMTAPERGLVHASPPNPTIVPRRPLTGLSSSKTRAQQSI